MSFWVVYMGIYGGGTGPTLPQRFLHLDASANVTFNLDASSGVTFNLDASQGMS
jgi:hypothetical protein